MRVNTLCQIWDSCVLHLTHWSKWDSQLTQNASVDRLWTHHGRKTCPDGRKFRCSSVRSCHETSVAQLWSTVAGIQASHTNIWELRSGWKTLFLWWIVVLLIYILRQRAIFPPAVHRNGSLHFRIHICCRLTLYIPHPVLILLESSSFFYLFNIAAQTWVSTNPKVFRWLLPWYQNAPKAGKINHKCTGELNIYFVKTQSDSELLTCCNEPVSWPPVAALHQLSIHHLPVFLPYCCAVHSSTDTQPPCKQPWCWNAMQTCLRSHYHLVPPATLSFSLKQISCKTGLNPRCYK